MTVGVLAPGVAPARIVPITAAAVRQLTTVEAADIAVIRGAAHVTVRFTGDDDEHARQVAAHTVVELGQYAVVGAVRVTRRDGGSWLPVSRA